jgi:hypothetical protein
VAVLIDLAVKIGAQGLRQERQKSTENWQQIVCLVSERI